jgi:hypothetical protein
MQAVGQILLDYDDDKQVPMYGFGAKPKFPNMQSRIASHCFPLTGNHNNPNAQYLEGMMQVYQYAIQHVELAGPTLFCPLITEASKMAANFK